QGVRGQVESSSGEAPLVVRSSAGFGEVIFVTADLDAPPLADWKARPEFIAALLGRQTRGALSPAAEVKGQGMHYGYDDLIGQLRAALDRFPHVRFVPFWLIASLAGGYILLLFPLDYLLSRRRLGATAAAAPAWPWVRFFALVAAVAIGACLLGLN